MGRPPRRKQLRLAKKLLAIRLKLNLSQSEIVRKLGLSDELGRNNVSNFEQDKRIPSLFVLLRYARLAGVCMELIVDDELELPERLPNVPAHDSSCRSGASNLANRKARRQT
ncbi:MAG: helix-turn-helix domain-containing protein [Pyrinomonadaceae bacterium]